MKKKGIKKGLVLALSLVLALQAPASGLTSGIATYAYTAKAARVHADNLNVRSGPGTNHSIVAKLGRNTSVTVIDETSSGGRTWYKIQFSASNGTQAAGYAASEYIRFPVAYSTDAEFENYLNQQGFPESYKDGLRELHALYPNWQFIAQHTGLEWNTVIQNESVIGRNLVHKTSISSWKSIADGAYDWDGNTWPVFDGGAWVAASEDVISYYMDPRNFLDEISAFQFLLQSYDASDHTADGLRTMVKGSFLEGSPSDGSVVSGGGFGDGGNSAGNSSSPSGGSSSGGPGATEIGPGVSSGSSGGSAVSPAGDSGQPSGEGQDNGAGQAPTKGGNEGVSFGPPPQAAIEFRPVNRVTSNIGPGVSPAQGSQPGSQPEGSQPGNSASGSTYVDILLSAGQQSGVNPYVLAAMIIQEQGNAGTSGSITGTASGYEGYYNFFNIEAYQAGNMSPVQRGLWYASQSGSYNRPWNTVEKSIVGGALFYGTNYVKAGQDTFYLKKFNVQGSNLYKHQYMTNIQGAASEASKLAQAYSAEMKQTALDFKIPVYQNMPSQACPRPSGDGSPNNKLRSLSVDGLSLTPTFQKDITKYDLIVDSSVSQIAVQAQAIDSAATVLGAGAVQLSEGNQEIRITVKAQNGAQREYVIYVARQSGGQAGGSAPSGSGPGGSPNAGPGRAGDSTVEITPISQ